MTTQSDDLPEPPNMRHDTGRWSRRGFLAGGAALVSALPGIARGVRGATEGQLGDEPTARQSQPPHTLLILEISGGNDGLSTVVPYADPLYYAARTRTAIARDSVLQLDEKRGLHPHLAGLRALYAEGRLAIVEGTGYPKPNLSHFTSQDIWHTARASGRASGEGWIGRLLRARHPEGAETAHAVHVGASLPYALTSPTHSVVHLETPSAYRWVDAAREIAASADAPSAGVPAHVQDLRAVIRGAEISSNAIRRSVGRYRPRVAYPDLALAQELQIVAALVQGQIGLEVLSVTHSGYDTHDNQRVRHDELLSELDASLSAFLSDIRGTHAGDRTVVLVFSEFGRRVADNASQGTDHGTAGPLFVLGTPVRGGTYGSPCSLSELAEGDLVHTTDFRRVYASVLEGWLGVPSTDILGARYPTLPLFA